MNLKGLFLGKRRSLDITSFPKFRTTYEQERIAHAKRIMKPFFLRRLKSDVLTDLPKKEVTTEKVSMSERQSQIYFKLVAEYKESSAMAADSGSGMLMNLRKCANHPLLIRNLFDDSKLEVSESDKAVIYERLLKYFRSSPDFSRHVILATNRRWNLTLLKISKLCPTSR